MIAEAVGVSHATVSRVLNDDPRVHPETRQRVIETARRMGYRLEPGSGRKTIALICSTGLGSYISSVLTPLLKEISRRGLRTELILEEDIELLNSRAVAGAIAVTLGNRLNEVWGEIANLPLVRLNRPSLHHENIYSVHSDGIGGMRLAVDCLHAKGHRRIAWFSDVRHETEMILTSHRYDGFIVAMRRIGVENPENDCYFNVLHTLPDIRALVADGVTAVIACGEMNGIMLASELSRRAVRVPEELSILSMEYPTISPRLIPPQTTLSQDFDGLARAALQLLERLIAREPVAEDVYVPYFLIERESVRALKS